MMEMEARILAISNPVECQIIERVNRFVVEVRVEEGKRLAYINNTGRLYQFLVRDRPGFCVRNEKPGKTGYRLFSIQDGSRGAIIDTQLQMRAFEKSVLMELLPWLRGYRLVKRNARLGNSVIDYLLACDGRQTYLEVKSAVLRDSHYAMYPDCPSARGRRHIVELTNWVKEGGEAIILFIAALPAVEAFKPNRAGDPELYELLLEARRFGVQARAIGMFYDPKESFLCLYAPDLRVE